MENLKSSLRLSTLEIPSKYSVFKRVANLILVIVGIIICINLWLVSSEQSTNWHNKQANQLGESLSTFSASVLTESIIAEDKQKLTKQLQFIAEDPHVLGASLFDNKGRQLADNQSSSSVVAAYKLNSQQPLVFVKSIEYQGKLIGYLRIMLKEEKVMEYHGEYQVQLNQQVIVLMLLAAAVGILIARIFYKFRYRSQKEN
jgi:membrane protein